MKIRGLEEAERHIIRFLFQGVKTPLEVRMGRSAERQAMVEASEMKRWIGQGDAGFTLMEVVVAVFIFLVGIVGVISLFAAAGVLHKSAQSKTMVSLAVQQVIAEIDARLKSGELRQENGELMPVLEGGVPGQERFTYRASLEEAGLPGQSMILARVQLLWREKGKERGEAFDYVFRPGPEIATAVSALRTNMQRTTPLPPDEGGGGDGR